MPSPRPRGLRRIGLTTATLLGLGLGVLVGLFFGEPALALEPVGNAYISLLQMAVLPYFIVALVYGLGRLSADQAKVLGINAAGLLLVLWALVGVMVLILAMAFPEAEGATPFSTNLVEASREIDFLALYIPANPFNSLANAIIPAVVVFGLAMGISLIGIQRKEHLLALLATLSDLLTRITQAIVKLTPIGVFALAASAAGTMSIDDLARLQVYLVLFAVGASVLAFAIVPLLISAVTPFKYRDVIAASRDALIMGFTTGNLLVVLPILANACKDLFRRQNGDNSAESTVDVVIPLSFPFPDIGTLLILLFIPFAAWYSGNPMTGGDFFTFLPIGFFSFFGNIEIGMPFLLDQLRIPADMFQLHVMTLVFIGRFATMLAVMHVTAVALITACAVNGMLRIQTRALLRQLAVGVAVLALAIALPTLLFKYTFDPQYRGYETFVERGPLFDAPVPSVHRESLPQPNAPAPGASRVEEVLSRGVLRVGFFSDTLPYVFTNQEGRLVGFDVEMASTLADELGVEAEWVRIDNDRLREMLDEGYCDIVMSKVFLTTDRLEEVTFSQPYMEETFAFVVPDYRREDFSSADVVTAMSSLRVAMLDLPYLGALLERRLPQAEILPVSTVREYFNGEVEADALLYTAESGSAWTLIYPAYSVAIPRPRISRIPLAYALPSGDLRMKNLVDAWIELKQKDGTTQRLYDYWILGLSAAGAEPRWSILGNVLNWVD